MTHRAVSTRGPRRLVSPERGLSLLARPVRARPVPARPVVVGSILAGPVAPPRVLAAPLLAALLLACGPDLDALRADPPPPPAPPVQVTLAPDAGAPDLPDAGAPPLEATDAGAVSLARDAPPPSCGLPGLSCCPDAPGCEVGACLRGRCASASGAVAESDGCADPCGARNPFTAGCSCAPGFTRSDLAPVRGRCHDGAPTSLDLAFCDGGYGSAFLALDPGCGGCVAPHPRTGACACPAGQRGLAAAAGYDSAACGRAPATLTLCLDVGARGAFQRGPEGCRVPNPETGACACPSGSVTQRLPLTRPWGTVDVDVPITLCLAP